MIHILGAMMVQQIEAEDAQGRYHLIQPFEGLALERPPPPYTRTGGEVHAFTVLLLWGGQAGQTYQLSTAVVYPEGDDREHEQVQTQSIVWPENAAFYRLTIEQEIQVAHKITGLYHLRFLFDGEPAGEVGFMVYWEDEAPPDKG